MKKIFSLRIFCSMLLAVCAIATNAAVWYVRPAGNDSNTGSSWAQAFQTLQQALVVAASGDEIWVAAGIYKPSAHPTPCDGCSGPRDFTFQLKDGVSLYGGFAGTETLLSQRNIAANTTTLSGDIGTPGVASDNVHHVVVAVFSSDAPTTRLDGFTITGGNANGGFTSITVNGRTIFRNQGGGIRTGGGTNTLTNNNLSGNLASDYGGGIYTFEGTNTLTNNTLSGNSATNAGGGIYTLQGTNTLANNSLSGNSASVGGGIYTIGSTSTMTNNSLSGNLATQRGGGIYTYQGMNTLMNNSLSGNWANFGGGIFTHDGTNTLTNNSLSGNSANNGGGIYTEFGTNMLMNNSLSGNSATNLGGGIYTYVGTNTLANNSLSGNSATNLGGGIYAEFGTNTLASNSLLGNSAGYGGGIYTFESTNTLTNNSLSGNSATNLGGGIFTNSGMNTLTNNIIWGNSNGIANIGSTLTVTHSIVQGGFAGTGNLNVDPLFVSQPPVGLGTSGDLRLMAGSPAIDAGTATDAPATDLDGNPRPVGAGYDMGAYEFSIPCPPGNILYVKADPAPGGANNGTSWTDAFTDLQSALASACPGITEIWVAAGIYKPSAHPIPCSGCSDPRDYTFQLKDGVSLYGGFTGTETLLSQRNIAVNTTTLSGDTGTPGDASDNVYHVVLAAFSSDAPTTRLDGFTITGGNANVFSTITVNGRPIWRRDGGGIYTYEGTNTLTNNSLSGNSANYGGGIYTSRGANMLTNNNLSGNFANFGGGIFTELGTNTLTNNSLSGNSASNDGGGIYAFQGTNTLTNNIIWGNSSGIDNDGSTLTVTYSVVQGGFAGTGNLNVDPLFVSQPPVGLGTSGDLRLQPCSPAINVGNNTAAMGISTDLNGNARIFGSVVDMGAYEFQAPPTTVIAICQSTSVELNANGEASLSASALNNGSIGCGTLNFTVGGQSSLNFTCADIGPNPVTLTVTDSRGQTATCMATVIVTDTDLPTVECFNQTITFNGETNILLNADNLVDATDNCGVASITLSPAGISCEQLGQMIPVTVTVTDVNNLTSTCTSNITVTGLPCGWSQNPNGVNCANGNNIAYNPGTGVWTATSTNCYSSNFSSDAAAFAQRTLCGDGSVTAQVTSVSGAMGWAGIVMRESNDAGAKKAQLMTNLSSLNRQEFRTTTGGQAMPQQVASQNRFWLRIVRAGNQFSMYASSNGQAWAFIGAQNITMSACIQIGLVATNATANSTVTATFANVSFGGGGSNLATPPAGLTGTASVPTDFSVFPNPTNGEVTVDLSAYENRPIRLEVYDLMGKVLQILETETMNIPLDLSAFQNGIYLIRVKAEGLPDATKRVVVQ